MRIKTVVLNATPFGSRFARWPLALGLASLLGLTFSVVQPCTVWAETALRFAQLSDLHMMQQGPDGGWMLLADAPALLDDWMAQIHQQGNVQFVVITGNAVNQPTESNFNQLFTILRKYPIPVYFCLGNRDIGTTFKTGVIQRLMREQAAPASVDLQPVFGLNTIAATGSVGFASPERGYYSITPTPTIKLLVLDTTPIEMGKLTGKGQLGKAQLDWLHQELEAEAKQPNPKTVIIAMHHPLMEPFASPARRLADTDRQALQKELDASPLVSVVLSGAYHAAKIQRNHGVLHISSPSLVDYPLAGRVYTLDDRGQLTVDWLPTRLTRLVSKSKSRSPWVSVSAGNTSTDQHWHGPLRYYPTLQAVSNLKAAQNQKRQQAAALLAGKASKKSLASDKNPGKDPGKDPLLKLLPKPAPIVVEAVK